MLSEDSIKQQSLQNRSLLTENMLKITNVNFGIEYRFKKKH